MAPRRRTATLPVQMPAGTSTLRGSAVTLVERLRPLDAVLWELPASTREDMRVPARVFADRALLAARGWTSEGRVGGEVAPSAAKRKPASGTP